MDLYGIFLKEQIELDIKLGKDIETVFDMSYLLIDFQAVVNGLEELICSANQPETMEKIGDVDRRYKEYKTISEELPADMPLGQLNILPDAFLKEKKMLPEDVSGTEERSRLSGAGYKPTTSRRFNEKYRDHLKLKGFHKGSLILEVAASVMTGLLIEFIKELVLQKTGRQDTIQVTIHDSYIMIQGSDIKSLPPGSCIAGAVAVREGSRLAEADTGRIIREMVHATEPGEDIEESVKRLLLVLENNGVICQNAGYNAKGMRTFVRDTERFVGNIIDLRA